MIYAPLVMPEVITGLSMLLLFVAISIDRGFWTVVIAHATMAMCFVAVIVQARLVDFDWSLEEAAMDLGASPARSFVAVTLPLILPAIAASWMLAFALSLDDLVIASFTTGPGATTLPIRIYSEVRLGVKSGDECGLQHHGRRRRRCRHYRLAPHQTRRGKARAGAALTRTICWSIYMNHAMVQNGL